jgi:hypothetical protein
VSDLPIRGLLAIFGGYAVAAIWTVALARALPLVTVDATTAAALLSFALYATAAIWAFAARSISRASLGLTMVGLLGALPAWVMP